MKNPLIPLFLLLLIIGCGQETLDLSSNTYFGVKEVLTSMNCEANCGETADCEGVTIRVKGRLDDANINAFAHQFYLLDESQEKFTLEVKVDEAVSADVFQKLNDMGGEVFLVKGEMEGYDASTNCRCTRQFLLRVDEASDVEME